MRRKTMVSIENRLNRKGIMMSRIKCLLWMLVLTVMSMSTFTQCSKKGNNQEPNEYVAAFTSGYVSRNSSPVLILSSDIDNEYRENTKLDEIMSVSPDVKGTFSFSDSRTIVFKPSVPMQHATEYTISAKLSKLSKTMKEAKNFSFSFTTYPLSIMADMREMSVNEVGEYVYTIDVRSVDDEEMEMMESSVEVSATLSHEITWTTKTTNEFVCTVRVKPDNDGSLYMKTKGNEELGLEERTLLSVDVPSNRTFQLVDAKYVMDETRYVSLTFNQRLDTEQDLMGLAYLEDSENRVVERDGNKIKLFPDNNLSERKKIEYDLSSAIRSESGQNLGKSISGTVEVDLKKPQVRFMDGGVIVPKGDKIIVPFKSVYMKGVRVRVFKIFANNLTAWIQSGNMDSYDHLRAYGRPIVATTFYIDEGKDLSRWNNYAIDLTNLMSLEPGCLYRVELGLDYRLSAWPGMEKKEVDRSVFEQEDKVRLTEMSESFDADGEWYWPETMQKRGGEEWNWEDRDNPSKPYYYYSADVVGKNILATNIGLMAMSPYEGNLTVIATDLMTAEGLSGVEVKAYNRQRQLIDAKTTDSDGRADFESTPLAGVPYILEARKNDDVNVLRVVRGEELSTSTFDVSGENVTKGLKGYIYGERGVWRPGDTLYLSFILNDRQKNLPEDHPVVMSITNPLGQNYKMMRSRSGRMGLYTFAIPTEESVPTGSWQAKVEVGGCTFTKYLRIESIKPNRMKIALKLPDEISQNTMKAPLHVEWLSGGKTHNQRYSVSAKIVKGETKFDKWKGFVFDGKDAFESVEEEVSKGATDVNGDANISFRMPNIEKVPGKFRCSVTTKVYEPSGEFSTDVQIVDYSPCQRYVGVRIPDMGNGWFIPTGKPQQFEIAAVDTKGVGVPNADVKVSVYKMQWSWWWNCGGEEGADYYQSNYNTPVQTFNIKTNAQGKGVFSLNVKDKEWGNYLIKVEDANGKHYATTVAYFDWPSLVAPRNSDGGENVTTLAIKTDKESYKVGENITVSLPSIANSRVVVFLCNSAGIIDMKYYQSKEDRTTVVFKTQPDMFPNVYVCASLIQPYTHTKDNDVPIRLYGMKSVAIDDETTKLKPFISCNAETKPMQPFEVQVKEEKGRPMAYTLAVVDEGLLDLTRFKTPNAWDCFNAHEALGLRLWDMYSMVSGAFGGRIEQMFSVGGDEGLLKGSRAIVNRFKPMVYFGGPFYVEKGKTNKHNINVPNYNGRVRVMVVATDGTANGSVERSVFVRKPLMVLGTAPRQIGVGDEMTVSATVISADKNVKSVRTTLSVSGGLQIVGPNVVQTNFNGMGDQTVKFRVRATDKEGVGMITFNSVGTLGTNDKATYTTEMKIRAVSQSLWKTESFALKAGEKQTKRMTLPNGDNTVINLEVSQLKPMNLAHRVAELMEYPHGCVEQITSKGIAQLLLPSFVQLTKEQQQKVEQNVKETIAQYVSYQTNLGGMSYWPNGTVDHPNGSYYALLFLNKAVEKGYYVDGKMMDRLKEYVMKTSKGRSDDRGNYVGNSTIGLWALSTMRSSNMVALGEMNRLKENLTQLDESDRCLLSAAYSQIGQKGIAQQILKKNEDDSDKKGYPYGGGFIPKNVANLLALTYVDASETESVAEEIRTKLVSGQWMSTIETAMALYAFDVYYQKNGKSEMMNFTVSEGGKTLVSKNEKMNAWMEKIEGKSQCEVKFENKGKSTIYVTMAMQSDAHQAEITSITSPLDLKVEYKSERGTVDFQKMEQGMTYKAVITIENRSGKMLENIAVTHLLPAGVEVLSNENSGNVSYTDMRDDRVMSYIDRLGKGEKSQMTLQLSATYAGAYYVPATTAEAMYDHTYFSCTSSMKMKIEE